MRKSALVIFLQKLYTKLKFIVNYFLYNDDCIFFPSSFIYMFIPILEDFKISNVQFFIIILVAETVLNLLYFTYEWDDRPILLSYFAIYILYNIQQEIWINFVILVQFIHSYLRICTKFIINYCHLFKVFKYLK